MRNLGLVPLMNFGIITGHNGGKKVYRSAQPEYQYQYDWIANNLNSLVMVNLRAEKPFADRLAWDGAKHLIEVEDHQPPTVEQALEFMRLVRDHEGDILIHCLHGHGRTSTFSVLAKVALGWSLNDAIEDEKTRFHYSFKHQHQEAWLRENITHLLLKLGLDKLNEPVVD